MVVRWAKEVVRKSTLDRICYKVEKITLLLLFCFLSLHTLHTHNMFFRTHQESWYSTPFPLSFIQPPPPCWGTRVNMVMALSPFHPILFLWDPLSENETLFVWMLLSPRPPAHWPEMVSKAKPFRIFLISCWILLLIYTYANLFWVHNWSDDNLYLRWKVIMLFPPKHLICYFFIHFL